MLKLVLLGLALASTADASRPRPVVETRLALEKIATALREYKSRCGEFPSVEEGLDVLAHAGTCLAEPLLDVIPRDGWNRCVNYELANGSFRLTSFGRDGREGGNGADADIVVTK